MLRPTPHFSQKSSFGGHNLASSSSSSSTPMSTTKSSSPTYSTLTLPPSSSSVFVASGHVGSSRNASRGGEAQAGQAPLHWMNGNGSHTGPASSSSTADTDEREKELEAAFEGYDFDRRMGGGHGKHSKLGYHTGLVPGQGHGHGNNNKYQRFSSPASSTHSGSSPLLPHAAGQVTTNHNRMPKHPLATKKDQRRLTLSKAEARRLKLSGTVLGAIARGGSGDEDDKAYEGEQGDRRRISAMDKGKGRAVEDGMDGLEMSGEKEWVEGRIGAQGKKSAPGKASGRSRRGKHGHRRDIADGFSVSASGHSDDLNSSSEHTVEDYTFDLPMPIPLALTRQCSPASTHSQTRSNDSRSRRERRIPQPPPRKEVDDDAPLPAGMDAMEVEDVFLDEGLQGAPEVQEEVRRMDRSGLQAMWESDDEDDEAILFAALDEMSDTAQSQHGEAESADGADSSDDGITSDDDLMNSFGGRSDSPFGFGDSLPMVLMEDWSGNLVFAQPRVGSDGTGEDTGSRSTSKSRSKNGKSKSGSKAGSAMTEEAPAIVIDAEAMDEWDGFEEDENGADDGGDTTDSLPDEDMPSPPDIMPFSLAAAGLEANNAAFGVTTVDEAALARDLGLPLADARSLLERAMQDEQRQILIGPAGVERLTPGDLTEFPLMAEHSNLEAVSVATSSNGSSSLMGGETSAANSPATIAEIASLTSPLPRHEVPQQLTPAGASSFGPPQMGAFLPSSADPKRVAVIDGTGKLTPSPFTRRGHSGSRSCKRGGGSVSQKKRAVGEPPLSPSHKRQRHSSVPAPQRGHFAGMRGSPLRQRANPFDREDTPPSDQEVAAAAPISIDDVLDTSALNQFDAEYGEVNNLQSRHLRNLRRWDRVPVNTFRQSRAPVISFPNGIGPGIFGGGRALDYTPSNTGLALRETFSSGSAPDPTLSVDPTRGQAIFGHGLAISPVLGPIDESTYASRGSPESKYHRDRNGDRAMKQNKLRTSSMSAVPALHLS